MTTEEIIILESLDCGVCGIKFAVPTGWLKSRREKGTGFHCPNGCSIAYHEPEVEILRKKLETRERELRESKCEVLRKTQLLDEADRKLRRVDKGVCPCCNRFFTNLSRHMARKHKKEEAKP